MVATPVYRDPHGRASLAVPDRQNVERVVVLPVMGSDPSQIRATIAAAAGCADSNDAWAPSASLYYVAESSRKWVVMASKAQAEGEWPIGLLIPDDLTARTGYACSRRP